MKRNIFFSFAIIVALACMTSCNSSKRCGCPTFGQKETTKGEWACVTKAPADLY